MAKEKVEFNPSVHAEQLHHIIKQCSDHRAIIESANEAIRELRKAAQDELGYPGGKFNKMLNMFHKDQREEFENASEEVFEDYDAVFTK